MVQQAPQKPKRLVFYFGGTGESSQHNAYDWIDLNHPYDEDVIRIYINGCQNPNVGGSAINPDLERVVQNIQSAFSKDKDGTTLSLEKLKTALKSGLHCVTVGNSTQQENNHGFTDDLTFTAKNNYGDTLEKLDLEKTLPDIKISEIAMMGFSRGAVTTFAVAKGLDKFGVPMSIIANQPVPGETVEAGSLVKKYQDCSELRNVTKAVTILAQHDKTVGTFHDTFFKQMRPKFRDGVEHQCYFIPAQSHWGGSNAFVHDHIALHMSNYGFSHCDKELIEGDIAKKYELNQYSFTPLSIQQPIHGVKDNQEVRRDPYFEDYINQKSGDYLHSIRREEEFRDLPEFSQGSENSTFAHTFDERYMLSILNDLASVDENAWEQCKTYFKMLFVDKPSSDTEQHKSLLMNFMIETYELGRYYEKKIIKNNVIKKPTDKYPEELLEQTKQNITKSTKQYTLKVFEALNKFYNCPKEQSLDPNTQKQLYTDIDEAGKNYSNTIMNQKGIIHRSALLTSLDIISHVTLIGMLANFIKKLVTGKWLISQTQTKTENLTKKNTNYFKAGIKALKALPTHSNDGPQSDQEASDDRRQSDQEASDDGRQSDQEASDDGRQSDQETSGDGSESDQEASDEGLQLG